MMSLIHRHTVKISNRLAVVAALMLAFSAYSGSSDSTAQREAMQAATVQHAVVEQVSPSEDRQERKLSISLLIFGRG